MRRRDRRSERDRGRVKSCGEAEQGRRLAGREGKRAKERQGERSATEKEINKGEGAMRHKGGLRVGREVGARKSERGSMSEGGIERDGKRGIEMERGG